MYNTVLNESCAPKIDALGRNSRPRLPWKFCNFHMIMLGLFDNAIAQSGSPLNPWAFQEKPLLWAQYLATEVRCPVDDTRALFDCLQQREANHLVEGHGRLTVRQHLMNAFSG